MIYILEIPHQLPPIAWSRPNENDALEAINSDSRDMIYNDLEHYREDYDAAGCHVFYTSEEARKFVKMAQACKGRITGQSGDDGSAALAAELDKNGE